MQLRGRLTQPEDFPELLEILSDRHVYSEALRARLPGLWRAILQGSGNSGLVEDLDRPPGRRILTAGVSAFVRPGFAAEIRSGSFPCVDLDLLRRWVEGRSPLLTPAEVRAANSAEGLHLFIGFNGLREGIPPGSDDHLLTIYHLTGCFHEYHLGFRFNEILEQWDLEAVRPYLESSGYRILREGNVEETNGRRRASYVYGITREDALAAPGTALAAFFISFAAPRILFTPREQELLQLALLGHTDEELARDLALSLSAVKKRWTSIYERAAASGVPELEEDTSLGGNSGRRGAEKRRRLLAYIRDHRAELRPVDPARMCRSNAEGMKSPRR